MSGHSDTNAPFQPVTDCQVCLDIWRHFVDPESAQKVIFGSSQDAHSILCSVHGPLAKDFVDYVKTCHEHEQHQIDSNDVGLLPRGQGSSVWLTESNSKLGIVWSLLLVRRENILGHPGTGRLLDPEWVDLDIIKEWKRMCLTDHGAKCHNPLKVWPVRPAWLIDVEKRCIVPGQSPGEFVALSYRWGDATPVVVDADTLARLREPYALDGFNELDRSAPIIRHAMHVTAVLGERYLWADVLCIPRGEDQVMTEQLKMMGAIYANAFVTIIAGDGDSQEGLFGLRGVSSPRDLRQRVIPFGEEKLFVRNTDIFSLQNGPYHDRGWTYQEYKLARRRLFFHSHELHWECTCSVWHEEMIPGAEADKYLDPRPHVIIAGFPDLESLSHITGRYNEKLLRYDEDALPAITGLLSVMSRSFTGGFLYGIPEMFFDRALGWGPPWIPFLQLRRRTPSHLPEGRRLSPSGLPSWSWIGWEGLVSYGISEACRINRRVREIGETTPITEWYTSNSPHDPPSRRRRIRSTWFENRDGYKDFTRPLPAGWTRHEDPPRIHPDGCARYTFTHADLPDDDSENAAWFYPFPVPEVGETMPPCMPEQTRYLFCETERVWLRGYRDPHRTDVDGMPNKSVGLRSCSGIRVGCLDLPDLDSLSLFPEFTDDTEGLRVELVALYKSAVVQQPYVKGETGTTGPKINSSSHYAVLWIEWKEGVAYRLANGKVNAAAWLELEPDTVSLVLG
ncbi:hypothetical protein CDD80_2129 [Ophiocordyceps camponoti-rufipedis]|uniref:Heterokaryon incompatibility domain-containing protein n=1 Tax=Ophiocordyceps camponoti-rufipedis TaxID=2004952 RepID=A0A2C5YQA7_9HYPO|nr:hypothetical protein CDD80_2129 [Ophiocordyceps camponoti-rufipedis]